MKISPRKKKWLKWFGYSVFAEFCFVVALIYTFPIEPIKVRLNEHLKKNFDITIESETMDTTLPIGIKATEVVVSSTIKDGPSYLPITIPKLSLGLGLLSAISGGLDLNIDAEIFGGEIDGQIKMDSNGTAYDIDLEVDDVKYENIAFLKNSYKELPIKGNLSIDTDVKLDLNKVEDSAGYIEIAQKNGVMGPGKISVEIPEVKTGTLTTRMELNKGKLEVKSYNQSSPDMQSDLMGYIQLSKKFALSRANLEYRFKLNDELIKKHSIFELALSAIRNAEGTDKYFYYTFRGPLSSVRATPNKAVQYKFRKMDGQESKPSKSVAGRKSRTSGKANNEVKSGGSKTSQQSKSKRPPRAQKTPRPKRKRNVRKTPSYQPKIPTEKQGTVEDSKDDDEEEEEEIEVEEDQEEENEDTSEPEENEEIEEEKTTDDTAEEADEVEE